MDSYKVYIITEEELGTATFLPPEKRFALALPEGMEAGGYAAASAVRRYPGAVEELLDPQKALAFLTWLRFAGRHYGWVVCAGTSEVLSVLTGLLDHWDPSVEFSVSSKTLAQPSIVEQAVRTGSVLVPLVGTQYTAIEEFRLLIAELRQKCPWDRQQTHVSLLETLLEESYEVALAIEKGSMENLKEELGDLLLQIFMQSEIAREEKVFDICDVIHGIDDKLTFRHPHVFGETKAESSEQVLDNWQKLKAMEGRKKHFLDSAKLLSTMENALLSQEMARADGFDFESVDQAYDKLLEESHELGSELTSCPKNDDATSMELGDVLFSALNVARLAGINPVKALRRSLTKFRDRYQLVRAYAAEDRLDISTASAEKLDELWQRAKNG